MLGLTSSACTAACRSAPACPGFSAIALGWQFLFFSVVPIGIIAWLLMYCNVRCDWKDAPDDPFDWRGSLFYTLAVSLLSIGAIWLFSGAWAGVLFALGVVFLGLFLWEERRSHHPILDVAFLVKNKAFALSTLASFINYSSIFSDLLFSLYLQGVHNDPCRNRVVPVGAACRSGVYFTAGGRMADRHGADIIATIGIAGAASACCWPHDGASLGGHAGPACDGSGTRCSRLEHQRDHDQCGRSAHGQASGLVGTARTLGTLSSMVIISRPERLSGRRGARPEQYS
ncbi:MAG: hypothetical protein ACLSTO_07630 [Bilophila wadsworthia]